MYDLRQQINYPSIPKSWGVDLSFSPECAASIGFVCLTDGEDSGEAALLFHKYLKTLEFPLWNYYMWMDSYIFTMEKHEIIPGLAIAIIHLAGLFF